MSQFKFLLPLIFVFCSCSSFFGVRTKTEKPNSDISTKTVRHDLERPISISKFEVKVIDDTLNLFKNNALVRIEIEGVFKKKEFENVFFDEIDFIEMETRPSLIGPNGNCNMEINLLPRFTDKKKRKDRTEYSVLSESVSFKTSIEYRLYSLCFGKNVIAFNLEKQHRNIELMQRK